MIQRIKRTKASDERGLTLMELLVVVVVLGILASIVMIGIGQMKSDATKSACQTDAKTVTVAAEAWRAHSGGDAYPTQDQLVPQYVKVWPTSGITYDPSSGEASCSAG
jgi:general secretion pathway protein G